MKWWQAILSSIAPKIVDMIRDLVGKGKNKNPKEGEENNGSD